MRSISKTILTSLLVTAWLLAGCSLFIEGLEEGRPCKDGRCPYTMVCVEDRCVTEPPPVTEECDDDEACSCAAGNGFCGDDGQCRCLTLDGRFEGTGQSATRGRFDLAGASLSPVECVHGEATYAMCGGLTQ